MYFVGKLIRRRPKQCNRSTPTPWSAQLRERAKSVELLGTELGARRHFQYRENNCVYENLSSVICITILLTVLSSEIVNVEVKTEQRVQ